MSFFRKIMGGKKKGRDSLNGPQTDIKVRPNVGLQITNTTPDMRTREDDNENERLQNINWDLRETSMHNKQLLDDYLSSLSDRDSVIRKMKEELDFFKNACM